jgi:hypothetical protein
MISRSLARKAVMFVALAGVATAVVAQPANSPMSAVPTLDGLGLASLAGALAAAGAWAVARHRANKD